MASEGQYELGAAAHDAAADLHVPGAQHGRPGVSELIPG